MAFHQLLSLLPPELVEKRRGLIAQWGETDGAEGWEQAPDYGTFVDDTGMVVPGIRPARVTLATDDPRNIELTDELKEGLGPGATVVFLDWGRQPLAWEEVFDLWDAWDSQQMIQDFGIVGVPWRLADRWVAPGWVVFREGFDGAPLTTVVRSSPRAEKSVEPSGILGTKTSFLARARELRGEDGVTELPMLPFTLESLEDPNHLWPQGVA